METLPFKAYFYDEVEQGSTSQLSTMTRQIMPVVTVVVTADMTLLLYGTPAAFL